MSTQAATFPPTKWTLIKHVRQGSEEERLQALEMLCRAYWFPLYAYARRQGLSEHESEDAVQSFIVNLLGSNLFAKADQAEGRLRYYLVTSFSHYLSNRRRHNNTQRRGGAIPHIPLPHPDAEGRYQVELASSDAPPDVVYHRKWAESLIERTINRLKTKFESHGQGERFRVMRAHLPWNGADQDVTEAAAATGMTPGAFRTALHRMRKEYRQMIIDEVRLTLGSDDPQLIDNEIRELFQALAS
jgi:DNA-directed RNA polymerase specialized sigma24 family protein